jgi:hypothetical protein
MLGVGFGEVGGAVIGGVLNPLNGRGAYSALDGGTAWHGDDSASGARRCQKSLQIRLWKITLPCCAAHRHTDSGASSTLGGGVLDRSEN